VVGEILAASCPCGYQNDGLPFGAGMATFQEHASAPALCTTCAAVVTIDVMDTDHRCPTCGGEVVLYATPDADADRRDEPFGSIGWVLPDGRGFCLDPDRGYRCPRCSENSLVFASVMLLD